jgi:FMN reductase
MIRNDQAGSRVVVVGICGSLRRGSYTRMAVQIALQGAREVGAQTRLLDLQEYQLVLCDGKEDERTYPADVFRLRCEVRQAQGLILGTPEYHGSFSGVLKNALDLMGFDEIEGKMIGWLGSQAAPWVPSMRSTVCVPWGALHAWVVSEQASIPEAYKVFDPSGILHDHDLETRLQDVGRQVARFAYLHASEHAQAFLRAWEGAPVNPGSAKDAPLMPTT